MALNETNLKNYNILEGASPSKQTIQVEATSANADVAIGTKISLADGRCFTYSLAGAAIAAGALCEADSDTASAQFYDMAVVVDAGTGLDTVIGDYKISLTNGTVVVVAGEFTNGYVCINDATGEGWMYKISGNTAAASGADFEVTLQDPIRVATVAGTTEVQLLKNPYSGVSTTTATTLAGAVMGICPIAVQSGYYFWLQTSGVAIGIKDASTLLAGADIMASATAGAIGLLDTSGSVDKHPIGQAFSNNGAATEKIAFMLSLP